MNEEQKAEYYRMCIPLKQSKLRVPFAMEHPVLNIITKYQQLYCMYKLFYCISRPSWDYTLYKIPNNLLKR